MSRTQVLDYGIDVGWNDNNEYGLWDGMPTCDGFGQASPARPRARRLQAAADDPRHARGAAAASRTQRRFTVTRAGCPGIQRYAQTWSGDNATGWRSLKWNLRTGLQMSLSGMFNIGHDVGGFSGPVPDAELLIRWTQAGSIHPRFIMNSWKPDGVYTSPWLHAAGDAGDPGRDPAALSADALSLFADASRGRAAAPAPLADLCRIRADAVRRSPTMTS